MLRPFVLFLLIICLPAQLTFAADPSPQDQLVIRAIQCFDNLRQIGMEIDAYALDHNEEDFMRSAPQTLHSRKDAQRTLHKVC